MNRPERLPPPAKPPSALADLLATRESAPKPPLAEPSRGARSPARTLRLGALRPGEPRSLFGEIIDWMFAPLLLLWPLSIAFTFFIARSLADAPMDRALIDQANAAARYIQAIGEGARVPDARQLRALLGADTDDTPFFQVAGARGELLAGDPGIPAPGIYDFPTPDRIKLRTDFLRGREVRIAYAYLQPSDAPGGEHAPALVQVAETLEKRNALANEIIKGVIFPQFVILPVAVALIWFGLGLGLAPLGHLQQRIRARRPDDLSPIDPGGAPEELAPLLGAFNELLVRLDANVAAQKRFIADAAHQMKTPLAGLRVQAEVALRETEPEELRRRLQQIAIGSERAAHLIDQLLSLARTENMRDTAPPQPLDIAPLARAAAAEWAAAAIRLGIDFGFEADERPARIAGRPLLLHEMFGNLIDNALRYTPRGGTVTARVARLPQTVVFEVEDNGPGIPPAERELVFERFYRVLGTDTDGSGLGLAIVREIAAQHAASVEIGAPSGPTGTRITVRFPKLPDAAPALPPGPAPL